eukprot:g8011.t1
MSRPGAAPFSDEPRKTCPIGRYQCDAYGPAAGLAAVTISLLRSVLPSHSTAEYADALRVVSSWPQLFRYFLSAEEKEEEENPNINEQAEDFLRGEDGDVLPPHFLSEQSSYSPRSPAGGRAASALFPNLYTFAPTSGVLPEEEGVFGEVDASMSNTWYKGGEVYLIDRSRYDVDFVPAMKSARVVQHGVRESTDVPIRRNRSAGVGGGSSSSDLPWPPLRSAHSQSGASGWSSFEEAEAPSEAANQNLFLESGAAAAESDNEQRPQSEDEERDAKAAPLLRRIAEEEASASRERQPDLTNKLARSPEGSTMRSEATRLPDPLDEYDSARFWETYPPASFSATHNAASAGRTPASVAARQEVYHAQLSGKKEAGEEESESRPLNRSTSTSGSRRIRVQQGAEDESEVGLFDSVEAGVATGITRDQDYEVHHNGLPPAVRSKTKRRTRSAVALMSSAGSLGSRVSGGGPTLVTASAMSGSGLGPPLFLQQGHNILGATTSPLRGAFTEDELRRMGDNKGLEAVRRSVLCVEDSNSGSFELKLGDLLWERVVSGAGALDVQEPAATRTPAAGTSAFSSGSVWGTALDSNKNSTPNDHQQGGSVAKSSVGGLAFPPSTSSEFLTELSHGGVASVVEDALRRTSGSSGAGIRVGATTLHPPLIRCRRLQYEMRYDEVAMAACGFFALVAAAVHLRALWRKRTMSADRGTPGTEVPWPFHAFFVVFLLAVPWGCVAAQKWANSSARIHDILTDSAVYLWLLPASTLTNSAFLSLVWRPALDLENQASTGTTPTLPFEMRKKKRFRFLHAVCGALVGVDLMMLAHYASALGLEFGSCDSSAAMPEGGRACAARPTAESRETPNGAAAFTLSDGPDRRGRASGMSESSSTPFENSGGAVVSAKRSTQRTSSAAPPSSSCKHCGALRQHGGRTHHCHICERCFFRRDHHCPFLGTCVHHGNAKFFFNWLLFVSLDMLLKLVGLVYAAAVFHCSDAQLRHADDQTENGACCEQGSSGLLVAAPRRPSGRGSLRASRGDGSLSSSSVTDESSSESSSGDEEVQTTEVACNADSGGRRVEISDRLHSRSVPEADEVGARKKSRRGKRTRRAPRRANYLVVLLAYVFSLLLLGFGLHETVKMLLDQIFSGGLTAGERLRKQWQWRQPVLEDLAQKFGKNPLCWFLPFTHCGRDGVSPMCGAYSSTQF